MEGALVAWPERTALAVDTAAGVVIAPLAAVPAAVDLGGDGASGAAGERVRVGVAVRLSRQCRGDRRRDEGEHRRTSGTCQHRRGKERDRTH